MKFAQDHNNAQYLISAYKPGEIQVHQKTYTHNILLSPNHLDEHWELEDIENITTKMLFKIMESKPELVLFGTGEKQIFAHPRKFIALIDEGIGYEIMDTASACRTYNILLGEDRNVVASLII